VPQSDQLSRRERQVMDVVLELGEATARDVQERLPKAPSYSAVRAVLTRLVDQGHLRYRESGPRYVYKPAEQRTRLRAAALRRTVDTFFEGSAASAISALLGISASELSQAELDELAQAIQAAREKSDD
jgi:predicted transcriptional regulator